MSIEPPIRPIRQARRLSPTMLRDLTASTMTLLAVAALVFLATVRGDATASGALISITSAAVGWYLRGRIEAATP